MGWGNDAMTIQFAHSKTDQEGKVDGYKQHLYADPDIPEICVISSSAHYCMAFPGTETGYLSLVALSMINLVSFLVMLSRSMLMKSAVWVLILQILVYILFIRVLLLIVAMEQLLV
jgi:hypothetical protein